MSSANKSSSSQTMRKSSRFSTPIPLRTVRIVSLNLQEDTHLSEERRERREEVVAYPRDSNDEAPGTAAGAGTGAGDWFFLEDSAANEADGAGASATD